MDILVVTSAQEADGALGAEGTLGTEGSVGVTEGRWLHWQTAQRTQAGDGLLCLSQLDLKSGSLLRTKGY